MNRMPLTTDCPGNSKCKRTNIEWYRENCMHRTYIDQDGYLSCEEFCSNPKKYYFIQEARFNCQSSSHIYLKFESINELIMQLSTLVSGLTFYEDSDPSFMANMLLNVNQRWKKK